ncbi:glycosyltransferase family 9 protein [Thalassotalea maritima]|uniref:glycosyltransferase family 9 protein n=1 Tax=Thalassotalea maritima TaxID=3242416 RepID=UPI003526EE88
MTGQTLLQPTSICILRLSALGDVCHTVAMVQQIQKQYPQTNITWVVGKVEHSLLQGLPGIEFIVFDKSQGWHAYQQLRQQMQGRHFDVLLHMQVALRASIASLFIPAKVKIGFDKARAKEGQWLFTNRQIEPQAQAHVVDSFMNFAKAIGVSPEPANWLMPFGEEERHWRAQHIPEDQRYCVISAAASKAERNWHAQGYAQVADYLSDKGYQVVLCGSPAKIEHQLAAQICELSQCQPINLVGKTSLKQMLAVLESAKLVVAPDTGPVHMAVSVATPVVGLYAHSNPLRTGPYLYRQYVVSVYEQSVEQQYGKSVNELPFGTRAKGQLMDNITLSMVTEQIDKLV